MSLWRALTRSTPAFTEQPRPLTDAEEWQQWRDFIGSKRTCPTCGAVMGDPDVHRAWHDRDGGER